MTAGAALARPASLPRWDVTDVYSGLDAPEFGVALDGMAAAIDALSGLFTERGIERRDRVPLDRATVEAFEEATNRLNALLAAMETLGSFVAAFVSTDSRDSLAQAKRSELERHGVRLRQLVIRYVAWIGSLDLDALTAESTLASEHRYPLERMTIAARHQMSPAEEDLASVLGPTGGGAWARLHSTVSSQIEVELELEGERRMLPMSAVRNLASEPDRDLRRRAHQAELAAWERWSVPLAAAMNGVKGEVLALTERRGWSSPLAEALHAARIDETVLRTLLTAAEAAFPILRRYLRAKARALGLATLAWYDLSAPLGTDPAAERWGWPAASEFILEHFGGYSPRLRSLAERAFAERWIDAEPRNGKRDGAFCMRLRPGESRILAKYQPTYDGVSTIAHELGHAYHNLMLADRPPLRRETPMTLAETASTFCETLVKEAALAAASGSEQVAILEASLQGATGTVVDIVSRFRFEERLFDLRQRRELAVHELNDLMAAAQIETYGDGIDQDTAHHFMWAVKPHYYSANRSFYNFPYLFGLLFGVGLYARYRQDPAAFMGRYDDLLAATGEADAAALAARFEIDLSRPDFWEDGLATIAVDVERFERLVIPPA